MNGCKSKLWQPELFIIFNGQLEDYYLESSSLFISFEQLPKWNNGVIHNINAAQKIPAY